jgi:fermentation-respiration switch protein FrsA (DUF1100 family)
MPIPAPDYALLDRGGASRQIFFPRTDPSRTPPGATDLRIEVAPGVELSARFYARDASLATILYFHGNGEVAGDHDELAHFYHASGANLFVVDFRGYGKSGGSPDFATLVSDAHPVSACFHEFLDAEGYSSRRFVMGRSLGSHPALEVAANAAGGFEGVIIESGAAILRRLIGFLGAAATPEEAETLSAAHEAKVRSITLPALIIHGEHDELVPLATAHALVRLLEAAPTELLVIPGAGHNDIVYVGLDAYFEAIARFVAE